jgi:hypothetical protein
MYWRTESHVLRWHWRKRKWRNECKGLSRVLIEKLEHAT